MGVELTEPTRIISTDLLGHRILRKEGTSHRKTGFIVITYQCRALEWLNIRKLFEEMLQHFHFEVLIHEIHDLVISWRYHEPLSSYLYKPATVFKQFSFLHLFDVNEACVCQKAKRLRPFLDPDTHEQSSSHDGTSSHVRTMDTKIIQHAELRRATSQGMNHIPLKPTSLADCVATIMDAFGQLISILSLENQDFPISDARVWLQNKCLD